MWRSIPLLKMVLRTTAFGLVLGSVEFMLKTQLPWFGYPAGSLFPLDGLSALKDSLTLGLALGIGLAVYAGLLHRTVYKPILFRFACVILGVMVSLLLVQPPFHLSFLLDELGTFGSLIRFASYEPWIALLLLLTVAKHVAIGMTSLFAASRYLRDGTASHQASYAQTLA
ncbi:MAG: hypothetical protein OXG78_05230 [Chloroflexi bacterium]|nr:hypothetical protein [Chloroflexota bacterium]